QDKDNTAFIDLVNVQPAPTPGLADDGFETPGVGSGQDAFKYNPLWSPWTFLGTSGISGNGSGYTIHNPTAPEGGQVAFLQNQGSFSQEVNFAAGAYTLSFLAAQRANLASSQKFQVAIDGKQVGPTFKPADTSYHLFTSDSFTVTAGS